MRIFNFRLKLSFFVIIILYLAIAFCNVGQPFVAKDLLDSALVPDMFGVRQSIIRLLVIIILLLFLELLQKLLIASYRKQLTTSLQKKVLKGLFAKPFECFSGKNVKEYISLFNNDLVSVTDEYYMQIIQIFFDIISILIYSSSLFALHPLLASVIIGITFCTVALPLLFKEKLQVAKGNYLGSLGQYNTRLGDALSGFMLIKTYLLENVIGTLLGNHLDKFAESQRKFTNISSFCEMLIGALSFFGYFFTFCIGGYLISKGSLSAGGLLATVAVSELLVGPVINIAHRFNIYNGSKGVKKNIAKNYGAVDIQPESISLNGKIEVLEIENLTFKYDKHMVLDHLNLQFKRGGKYLICGSNGSGKSTLFKILLKMYQGYEGNILVNDKQLRNIITSSYYEKIGIVFQDTFVFNDSLKNNIALYGNHKDDDIRMAIKAVGLERIESDIFSDKEYKEGEGNISGGELQKISLARAILKKKEFLFLDEAFSAFDKESGLFVEQYLLTEKKVTLINIAHKINHELIHYYDEVIVLKDGRVDNILVTLEEKKSYLDGVNGVALN